VAAKPGDREKHMTISDWQPFRSILSKAIVDIRAIGKTTGKLFIMTAHDEVNKDDATGALLITPNIPSKLAGNIGGFFSDVWHSESSEEKDGTLTYKVRTMPRGMIPSLGNSLNLPKEMVFKWEEFSKHLYKYEQPK